MMVSRRELATMIGAAAALPAVVEAQPASSEEAQSAQDLLRANAEAIAKVKLEMAMEPPFHFKA